MGLADQLAEVAKNLAETLVSAIYQKLHKILRKHWNWPLHAKDQGSWIEQVSQGTRTRQASALGAGIAQQSQQQAQQKFLLEIQRLQEETKLMDASMKDATDQQKQQFDQMDKITGHKIDLVDALRRGE